MSKKLSEEYINSFVGKRFGRLIVIEYAGYYAPEGLIEVTHWLKCKCDCGTIKNYRLFSLRYGETQSCGCLQQERSSANGKKMLTKYGTIRQERPDLVEYLVSPTDADKYSIGSSKIIQSKCPNCQFQKEIRIVDLKNQGFGCPICSDGISYPEKFMANILYELKINFTYQQKFKWSKNKRYDFYLIDYNSIIETHGIQHYRNVEKWDGLKQTKSNDTFKQENAYKNGIKDYYVVDCRKSDSSYILNSIEQCGLKDLLKIEFTKLDIEMIDERSHNSLLIIICEEFSKGLSQKEIKNKYKLDWGTIIKYLKIGANIGICTYETKYEKRERILPLIYNDYLAGYSINELEQKYKIVYSTVLRYLKKNGIVFREHKIVQAFKNNQLIGEYNSQIECAKHLNLNEKTISSVLRGKMKTCKGYIIKYKEIGE